MPSRSAKIAVLEEELAKRGLSQTFFILRGEGGVRGETRGGCVLGNGVDLLIYWYPFCQVRALLDLRSINNPTVSTNLNLIVMRFSNLVLFSFNFVNEYAIQAL